MAQKKRERAQAQAAEAKEMQKFYLVKAMAAPFAGQAISAPDEALAEISAKAAVKAKNAHP